MGSCGRPGARGITVANVPDYGTEEVADSAIGMTLTLMRGIHYLNDRLQLGTGPWSHTSGGAFAPGCAGVSVRHRWHRAHRRGHRLARQGAGAWDVALLRSIRAPVAAIKSVGIRAAETLDELLAQVPTS